MTEDGSRVVLKYYLYRATGSPGFVWPIYTLYLLLNGLTFTEIGTIATIQSIVVVAGEIPTGYVGDRIGRRNSLFIGSVLFTVSTASFLVATDFPGFVVTFSLLSFAQTFVSGSGQAWLYDILKERLDEGRYTHVQGRGSAIGQWVMAATMIGGGLLYVADPRYPFVVGAALNAVNAAVILWLPQVGEFEDDEDPFTIIDALPTIRRQISRPPLRSFVVYMALFTGALMTADMYIQPIAVDVLRTSLGSTLRSAGIAEPATLGFLYASFTVVSAIASDRASDLEAWLGAPRAMLFVPLLVGVLYVVPVAVPLLVFPMFFVMKASGSLVRPIAGQFLNDHTESVGRATVLSAVSMVYAVARMPFAIGSGAVADVTSPRLAVGVLGVLFVVGALAIHARAPPVADTRRSHAGLRELVWPGRSEK